LVLELLEMVTTQSLAQEHGSNCLAKMEFSGGMKNRQLSRLALCGYSLQHMLTQSIRSLPRERVDEGLSLRYVPKDQSMQMACMTDSLEVSVLSVLVGSMLQPKLRWRWESLLLEDCW
jgi:hypothetical protein